MSVLEQQLISLQRSCQSLEQRIAVLQPSTSEEAVLIQIKEAVSTQVNMQAAFLTDSHNNLSMKIDTLEWRVSGPTLTQDWVTYSDFVHIIRQLEERLCSFEQHLGLRMRSPSVRADPISADDWVTQTKGEAQTHTFEKRLRLLEQQWEQSMPATATTQHLVTREEFQTHMDVVVQQGQDLDALAAGHAEQLQQQSLLHLKPPLAEWCENFEDRLDRIESSVGDSMNRQCKQLETIKIATGQHTKTLADLDINNQQLGDIACRVSLLEQFKMDAEKRNTNVVDLYTSDVSGHIEREQKSRDTS